MPPRKTVALPEPVYDALKEAKPGYMPFYAFIAKECGLETDFNDL